MKGSAARVELVVDRSSAGRRGALNPESRVDSPTAEAAPINASSRIDVASTATALSSRAASATTCNRRIRLGRYHRAMSEKCPECNCQLDLEEGQSSDCCCGQRIERREGQLVSVGASSGDKSEPDSGEPPHDSA